MGGSVDDKISQLDHILRDVIKEQKKTLDSTITTIKKDLLTRMGKLEAEAESWKKEKLTMQEKWEEEKLALQEEINLLKGEVASLRDRPREKESQEVDKEAIKEEITKSLTHTIEGKMEAASEGWVQVLKKNIKEKVQEDVQELKKDIKKEVQEDVHMMQSTFDEEKMRRIRRLNIRVTGIPESNTSTPETDGRHLCTKLGFKEDEPLPFTRVWRTIPKDSTKIKALVLQFPDEVSRMSFMRRRAILRSLPGDPIYFDDDLTGMQLEHRKSCMPKIKAARKEGKKAHYRDGHIYIDGKRVE